MLPVALGRSVNVEVVRVAGLMASLNTTVTLVIGGTFVALLAGVVLVTVGTTVSTVQVRLAGVGSTLPAGSVARTVNVCCAFVRAV